MSARSARFEVVRTGPTTWHTRLRGVNGRILTSSEVLSSKQRAESNVAATVRAFWPSFAAVRDADPL